MSAVTQHRRGRAGAGRPAAVVHRSAAGLERRPPARARVACRYPCAAAGPSAVFRKMSTNQEKPHKLVVLKATADKGPLDSAWAFLDSEDIPSMSVADLTEALKERGLDSSGSKKVCPAAAATGSNQPAHQFSIPDKQR